MNVILNPSQSNTRRGDINLLANSNLTGKENYLWKIVNNAGVPSFDLPAAITDMAIFIGASGDIQGNNVAAEAPDMSQNCRVLVSGAVNPGDILTLDPNNWGKLYKPAPASGATNAIAIAEEVAAAGGLCLVRFIGPTPYTP